jgi:hypothetical protein
MADDLEEWLGDTTQHVLPRDIGVYLEEKFSATRCKLADAIEAQLKAFRALPENEAFPISRIPITEAPPDFTPDLPPPGGRTKILDVSSLAPPPRTSTEPPTTSMAVPMLVAVAAFLGVAVLGAGVVLAVRARDHEAVAATAPSARASAEAVPTEIDFTVKASPTSAKIFIDGKEENGNPVQSRRARDGAVHVVRAEAPGHEPRSEQVTFDRSFLVTLELKPRSAHASIPPPPQPPPRPPPPPVVVQPPPAPPPPPVPVRPVAQPRPRTPSGKPVNVDTENPY